MTTFHRIRRKFRRGAFLSALHPATIPARRNASYAALTRRFPTPSRILITLASVHSAQDGVGIETVNPSAVKTEQLQLVTVMRSQKKRLIVRQITEVGMVSFRSMKHGFIYLQRMKGSALSRRKRSGQERNVSLLDEVVHNRLDRIMVSCRRHAAHPLKPEGRV
jgi:hypothetical protein